MVCPAISSYSFGATALIFGMMFIHKMEVFLNFIKYLVMRGSWFFYAPATKSREGEFLSNMHKMTGSWTSFPSY